MNFNPCKFYKKEEKKNSPPYKGGDRFSTRLARKSGVVEESKLAQPPLRRSLYALRRCPLLCKEGNLSRILTAFVILLIAYSIAAAQTRPVSQEERLQGYFESADSTFFVFDAAIYNVDVESINRVVVTGLFRNWDQDMENADWHLEATENAPNVWLLAVPNFEYRAIPPGTPFKFRINDGRWLDPPADAANSEGGNLVFLYGAKTPRLRAELRGPRAIWAVVTGDDVERPLNSDAYRLTDAKGREIPIQTVLPNTASETLVVPEESLDIRRVYYLEIPSLKLRSLCSFDGWFRTLYSTKELGANVSEDGAQTVFRIFSPRADLVKLYLYKNPEDSPESAYKVIDMKRDSDGVWESVQEGDLHGVYYDFTVHGPNDPGNHFYETHPVHASDPYARVNVDAFGKSRVWRKTIPATPLKNGRPAMKDVIAYEVHVQDFTDLLPVSDDLKGTIPAMVVPGLPNSKGEPVGFDHLVNLGINTVHLMPIQEYLHYPDAEWQAAFKNDLYMIEQGINLENYQWGYRTTHPFAVETRFRKRGTEYGAQRDQFRDLVQAFHDKGIAVIVDYVFNHTGENMDGREYLLNLNVFDKQYYYRTNRELEHIGAYGNETKSENRPMMQRWFIDQCKHFIEEFGIDGFRIDLAGQTDQQTLLALRAALGDDIIIYGEPWIGSNDSDYEANPDWDWYKIDSPITFFQDDARNAFKGPPSNPENKKTDRGYAGGNAAERENVMKALLNSFPEEIYPNRGINYLDIHDNWALADRFAVKDWDGRYGVEEDRYKIAAGLLFTSLGPIVLHGGSEFMRSKASAPLEELVKEIASGPLYFHGKRDTYNLRKANQFVWENIGKTKADEGSYCDYQNMLAYWKGLIAFRLSDAGKVFRIADAPPTEYYRWILPENEYLLGYIVAEKVLVLINTDEKPQRFEQVNLPRGRWQLIANDKTVDHINGVSASGGEHSDVFLDGGTAYNPSLPAASLKIWLRK